VVLGSVVVVVPCSRVVVVGSVVDVVVVGPAAAAQMGPYLVVSPPDGNTTCATLNASSDPNFNTITSDFGAKTKGGNASQYSGETQTLTDPPLELTGGAPSDPNHSWTASNFTDVNTAPGQTFDWVATLGIDAVIVKGGANSNVYVYDPEAFSGSGLHAPVNPDNGRYFQISHIELCYDYELSVSKTATTSYDRTYNWTVLKTANPSSVTLAEGESSTVGYTVRYDASFTDSNFAASGNITISNPAPIAATITGVSDVLTGGFTATVDCGVTFPYTLAANSSLICSYSASLPDKTSRTNTATATTSGDVGGGTGTATASFNGPTNEIDKCIAVADTYAGSTVTGPVCFTGTGATYTRTFTYNRTVGPYQVCGSHEVSNTASFIAANSAATGSSTATVTVNVPCGSFGNGCTLTQGYWKNHAGTYGLNKANLDEISQWLTIWLGADNGAKSIKIDTVVKAVKTLDFDGQGWYSGKSDNGLNKLLGQMLAAKLNIAAGANSSTVDSTIAAVNAFLASAAHQPNLSDGGWSALNGPNKQLVLGWKDVFDKFNQGNIGPGKCTQ
jgi:hypothetical protein